MPKKIAAIPTSSPKVMQANGKASLVLTEIMPKACVCYKIGGLGLFLSKDDLRRGKAKLLLVRLSYCKKPYNSAFTGTL